VEDMMRNDEYLADEDQIEENNHMDNFNLIIKPGITAK
jgi:hypothetical protein